MTISQAIAILEKLKEKHGDVMVVYDCSHCGKVTEPTTIEAEVKLK